MDLRSTAPLFLEDGEMLQLCARYAADLEVLADDNRREDERSRVPVRLPERWISEQTELKLRRHDWREGLG